MPLKMVSVTITAAKTVNPVYAAIRSLGWKIDREASVYGKTQFACPGDFSGKEEEAQEFFTKLGKVIKKTVAKEQLVQPLSAPKNTRGALRATVEIYPQDESNLQFTYVIRMFLKGKESYLTTEKRNSLYV